MDAAARARLHLLLPADRFHLDVGLSRRCYGSRLVVNDSRILAYLAPFSDWSQQRLRQESAARLLQSLLLLDHTRLHALLLGCQQGGVRHYFLPAVSSGAQLA